ncbi:TetR/AcrR family transcriptional regulator [Pseudomonas sp. MF6776]|uniref:TetR/AcrR family transcriptional regulator n=1 Tax=Pseudomonas sp. MF6776 TaxID=2797534 RepID=UPI00190A5530|nr:TetR/AcrR family transcriptional regulator [Pseudomonas sp. MF6776]MBK3467338.1 TetR/AcrR family transcriptional regulator [Pseudomonas sp. MF6776]
MAQKRADMITETRGKLIKAARDAFAAKGYADSSMDDLTAKAGLTRGALYHHFGDKKGLLQVVIAQIDEEMMARLSLIIAEASTTWEGFIDESIAYIKMSLEPEIQRIVFLDGPSVLGDPSQWPSKNACIRSTQRSIQKLIDEGTIRAVNTETTARLIMGALLGASLWIANAEDPQTASEHVAESFLALASGLLLTDKTTHQQ